MEKDLEENMEQNQNLNGEVNMELLNNLKQRLESQKAEIDDKDDRLKRLMAEFDNFKKRSAKEREGLYNSLVSDIVVSLLPVIDNLEKAVSAESKDDNYKHGVELVLKQFKDVLKSKGVEEIEAIGTTFDPELHEAVSSVQDESKESQEIVQEYRKGYKLGSKVLRHSMVVVNN